VFELGIVLWVLIGWQFTLAEFVGGLVLVVVMSAMLRLFVSRRVEERARAHAQQADAGHQHQTASGGMTWRQRIASASSWSDVAHNFRNDWSMLYREIALGFVLAGFIGLLGNDFFNSLFITHGPPVLRTMENVIVGPLIAVLSFVCSVGNVPLAAVLWSGGISFAGVIAFIFADLIVVPIALIYRKYYGSEFALRIIALMFVTMVAAALIVAGLFSALGLVPQARPTRADVFSSIHVDYRLFTNILGLVIFAALFGLTMRRGARDPVLRDDGGPGQGPCAWTSPARLTISAPVTACMHSRWIRSVICAASRPPRTTSRMRIRGVAAGYAAGAATAM
jgi:uncharacterized protein